jgi:hypothetical protein
MDKLYEKINHNYRYNEDDEKANDLLDSLQLGKVCNGSYCENCDMFNYCNKEIKYVSLG